MPTQEAVEVRIDAATHAEILRLRGVLSSILAYEVTITQDDVNAVRTQTEACPHCREVEEVSAGAVCGDHMRWLAIGWLERRVFARAVHDLKRQADAALSEQV